MFPGEAGEEETEFNGGRRQEEEEQQGGIDPSHHLPSPSTVSLRRITRGIMHYSSGRLALICTHSYMLISEEIQIRASSTKET